MPIPIPIIDAALKIIDKVIPDKEAREKAKLELLKEDNRQVLEEVKTDISAIIAEANSSDKWTSRARPSFLYLMYFCIIMCFVGGIIGIWFPTQIQEAAKNLNSLLNAIPESLWWLFGAGYLGYTGGRTFDKWKQTKK
jgi:hypothetical protein